MLDCGLVHDLKSFFLKKPSVFPLPRRLTGRYSFYRLTHTYIHHIVSGDVVISVSCVSYWLPTRKDY